MELDELTEDNVQDQLSKEKIALGERILEEFRVLDHERMLKRRVCQRKMPLWLFMIVVLRADEENICVKWTKKEEFEFKVTNTQALSDVWGMLKLNTSMNYAKLTRALRYYYGKQLMEKVVEQPYTYRFVLSDKTRDYLPSPLVRNASDSGPQRDHLQVSQHGFQRPRSLPDSFRNFGEKRHNGADIKKKQHGVSFFSQFFNRSVQESPLTHSKERSDSLPFHSRWLDDPKTELVDLSNDSVDYIDFFHEKPRSDSLPTHVQWLTEPRTEVTDASNDSFDYNDPFDVTVDDWEDEFLLRKSAKQLKTPETSCFTANDLPLLDVEVLRSLEGDMWSETSTTCSYTSPQSSSEPSFEVDSNRNSNRCSTEMRDSHGSDTAKQNLEYSMTRLTTNNDEQPRFPTKLDVDVVIDMDTEMDIVQEYIIQHSSH